jgi:hypothetical protein
MSRDVDPILLEVFKNGFEAVADEMALILMRTAHSRSCAMRWISPPPCATRPGRTWPRADHADPLGSFTMPCAT